MKDDENIYMIYSPHGHAPQGVYEFFNEAMSDAKELSDKYPGESFHVMQAVNELRMPGEVIEVGDEITIEGWGLGRDGSIIHDVEEIRPDGQIHARPRTLAFASPEKCTLIRKGPKVHTFEKVMVEEEGGVVQHISGGPGLHFRGSEFWKLRGNGEFYTLTLKEEG